MQAGVNRVHGGLRQVTRRAPWARVGTQRNQWLPAQHATMFRIAHISDVHLGPLPKLRKRDLVSKRITGYLNWKRNRAKQLGNAVLGRIIDSIHAAAPDHVVVTGDLVNLSLDAELRAARLWMEALGEPEDVSFVPGNHDAYVVGALDKTIEALRPFTCGDNATSPGARPFPYVRVRGDIAIIGVNSARATPFFVAAGHVSDRQMEALRLVLDETGRRGLARIVLIHHPPVRGAAKPAKRLYGIAKFQAAVRAAGAELVLHGHTHLPTLNWIAGPDGRRVPVSGAPACAQEPGGHCPPAGWNEFSISGAAGRWSINMTRHRISGDQSRVESEDVQLLA
jgi:3',5'-cyclic AMP phosphodiesterase CpdA